VKVQQELESLRGKIRLADDQYYNRGHSDISDAEYDVLFVQLRKLEAAHPELVTADSPTQRVGAPLPKGGGFATRKHLAPMGSIESIMAADDVREFCARAEKLLAPLPLAHAVVVGNRADLLAREGRFGDALREFERASRMVAEPRSRSPCATAPRGSRGARRARRSWRGAAGR